MNQGQRVGRRTGLGEERAKALIGLGRLALLGEETVGLEGVKTLAGYSGKTRRVRRCLPEYRARGSTAR